MARIFITGSSDGLGLLAAKELVKTGHKVVLHARNEQRANDTKKEIPEAAKVVIADLASIAETEKLAEEVNKLGTFDAIIHNAGIWSAPENERTVDDLPLVFAVNSVAPYIMTVLINKPERFIYLSSQMHAGGDASVEKLNAIPEGKNVPTYSDTKLHDLILALAVARKFPNIISNAIHPGWVPTNMGGAAATDDLIQGYKTQVWLAVSQDEEAKQSGRYLFHKKEAKFKQQASNIEIQEKFLSICEQITGITLK